VSGPPPLCYSCRHFDRENTDGFTCKAFPDGIPDEIIESEVDHRNPVAGDHGIQYAPAKSGQPDPDPFEERP